MVPNPPPPTPEFLAADRWNEFFVPATVTFALSCTALVLRFTAALVARKKLWFDDYFAIIAAVCPFICPFTVVSLRDTS